MTALTKAVRLTTLTLIALLPYLGPTQAQIMVVGIDRKFAYDDNAVRQALEPGRDQVIFFDVSNPARPILKGTVDLENSILGPPTNAAVTPDQSLALIANAVHSEKTEAGWKAVPADELFVVDLRPSSPKLIQTVKVGRQPSGLAISADGTKAVVANRDSKSLSVLTIKDHTVTLTETVSLKDSVGSVAISPDGHRVIATQTAAHKATLLSFDATGSLVIDRDLWVGLFPWNVAIAPDAKTALVANIGNNGQSDGSAKTLSVIDLAAPTPFVRSHISVGDAPEGIVFSPRGNLAAITLLQGSYDAPATAWFKRPSGAAALLSMDGTPSVVDRIEVGAFPEGLAFSPDGQYLYVGNYKSHSISVLSVARGKLADTGLTIALPGPPASLRIGSQ